MEQLAETLSSAGNRARRRSALKMAYDAFQPVSMWQLMDERPSDKSVATHLRKQLSGYAEVWQEAARSASANGRYQAAGKFLSEVAALTRIDRAIVQLDECLRDRAPSFAHVAPAACGLPGLPEMRALLNRYDAQLQIELAATTLGADRGRTEREIDGIQAIIEHISRLDLLLRMKFEWDRRIALHRKMPVEAAVRAISMPSADRITRTARSAATAS